VMVGRACQGRPWHAGWVAGHAGPQRDEIADLAAGHYEAMLGHYGADVGVRHARKHVGWYLERFAPDVPAAKKTEIMTSRDPAFVSKALAHCLADDTLETDRRREAA